MKKAFILGLALAILISLLITPAPTSAQSFSAEFKALQGLLEESGFVVRLEHSPHAGSYGSLEIKSRTVWVNPVVAELGIAEPTLVHEAVHAAQLCADRSSAVEAGQLRPLGLKLETPSFLRPYFMRYKGLRRHVEREAYTVQVRGDRLEYVSQLLKQHCS